MGGLCCERRVLLKTRNEGELHELWVERGENALVVGEDSQGPLTEVAFGESWHRSMVRIDAPGVDKLREGGHLEADLIASDAPLCDLMDFLEAHNVAYAYLGLGSSGSVTLRGERSTMDFSQTLDERAGA